jgi:general secretion pathway protein D
VSGNCEYECEFALFREKLTEFVKERSIRSIGMRLNRIATVIILLIALTSTRHARAQEVNFDDLLNELNFGEPTATASPEADTETTPSVTVDEDPMGATDDVDVLFDDMDAAETEIPTGTPDAQNMPIESGIADDNLGFNEFESLIPEESPAVEAGEATIIVAEPEPEPVPTVTAAPDASTKADAKLMAQQEEVRRQAREVQGRKSYDDGIAALAAGKHEEAVRLLDDALLNIPVRPANDAILQQIRTSLGDAHLAIASEQMDKDLSYARRSIDASLANTPDNRRAQGLEKRISAREAKVAEEIARPKSVMEQRKYSDKYISIDQLLREGRDLFDAREYNDAELTFEKVLLMDEYNIEAMRFLRRIEERRFDIHTKEREATAAGMMAMVRETWNPPIRTDVSLPPGVGGQTTVDSLTSPQKLQKKMEAIIIPSIEFRQANITDVVNFLVDASVAGDPDGIGVNIILKLSSGSDAAPIAQPAPVDDFGFGGDFGSDAAFGQPAATSAASSGVPAITLNLRRINLLDAIKYITEVADLRYRLEDNVVIITPANVVSGRVVTRMYPVQPSILDVIVERAEVDDSARTGDFIGMGQQANIKRSDVKDFFERAGVPFPVGTSITYNQSISQLIVANTAENLETFERILSRLNVIPNQVEIEARFVEVNQNNLEELGFQWFLTDNWEIAQRGSGSPAGQETLLAKADPNGFTKGNRFFGSDLTTGAIQPLSTVTKNSDQFPLGGIMTFASVLTNPELTVIIQALSQKGNSDLLSAPRITTRSGVNAQIQVVQEIIYPTEFESETITFEREAAGGGTIQERFVTVTPGSFQTREVGVILNVTPTVGPDGYTIDLTLAPEVAELVDWIQYGSTVGDLLYNIPQPIFASRNVTTSIVVWDGQTVVMGGLIREDLVKYEDKIPFLGDIPILGRLFRSNGEFSQKKNLLIFVTARLVGPDGKPLQRGEGIPGADDAQAQASN